MWKIEYASWKSCGKSWKELKRSGWALKINGRIDAIKNGWIRKSVWI